MSRGSRFLWSMLLLLVAFIWGFSFVVVKETLDSVPTLLLLSVRFTVASIGLGIIFRKKLFALDKRTLRDGAVLGLILYLAYILQTYGCFYTTAGKNAFLTAVYCILVPFINFLLFRKKVNRYHLAAAFLSVAGIALLTLGGEAGVNIGDVLTLLSGIMFALQIIFTDRYTVYGDPISLTMVQLASCAALSWVSSFIFEGVPTALLSFGLPTIRGLAYLALFSTLFGFMMQNVAQSKLHPVTASVIMSMESVFGVLMSTIVLHESMNPRMFFGCAIMLTAVLMAEILGGDKEMLHAVS